MGKKTKRLYDRMQHGIGQKDSRAATLRAKAEALEAQEAKITAGTTKGRGKGDQKNKNKAGRELEGPATKKSKRKWVLIVTHRI